MEAYILDGVRTGIGNFGGSLSTIRCDDLAAHTIRHLMEANKWLDPSRIDDVILGCANQAGEDNRNLARMALLLAGLPFTVPGETVNRLCASGMSAVIQAGRAIGNGEGEVLIAGGAEHMTRGPWVISKSSQAFGRDSEMHDSSFGWRFVNLKMKAMYGTDSMGQTAENLAGMYKISRDEQDAFALGSQLKAVAAAKAGRFKREISAVSVEKGKGESLVFDKDEFIRPGTSMEGLAKLKTAFLREGGSVTAGNSSGLNDGSAALLIASGNFAKNAGRTPLARIVSSAVTGVEPRIMGIGPVSASLLALKRAGITLNQVDIIELNEAFAAQSIACLRELGIANDDVRLNPNGGAIALGHPLGMSGARILLSAAIELNEKKKRFALCTLCIGVGQGYAVVLENENL